MPNFLFSYFIFCLPKQVLQCFHTVSIHRSPVGFLDLKVYFLAVDGYFLGSGDADLDLVALHFQDGDLDVIVDDDRFVFLTG